MINILVISQELPYPLNTGGQVSIYNRLRSLSECANVDFIAINLEEIKLNDEINLHFKFLNFFRIYERKIKSFSKSPNKLNALLYWGKNFFFEKKPRGASIANVNHIDNFLIKNHCKYDLILFENYNSFNYFLRNKNLIDINKTGLICHNIETHLAKSAFKQTKNPIKRLINFIEYQKIKIYEKKVFNLSSKILCISNSDFKFLKPTYGDKVYFIAQHLSIPNLKWHFTNSKYIIYNTNLNFWPNIEGFDWFVNQIHPKLKEIIPNYKLYITGSKNAEIIRKYSPVKNFVFTGFLNSKDFKKIFLEADVMINPVRYGSGVKVKILDALAIGIPIVSLIHGVEGVDKDLKLNSVINEKGFLKLIIEALKSDRQKIAFNAREYNQNLNKKIIDIINEK